VGDLLKVRVINQGTHIHSFHSHLTAYNFSMDGSQANIIGGSGQGSMIAPGGEYTYEFRITEPGIFYYHCHSSDGAMISMHIRMGLYGAIVIQDPNAQKLRDEVIFYGEGQPGAPAPFVINNRGIPGGEMTLEHIFHEQGFAGVQAQLNVTVTAFTFHVGETVRLHIINIGDQVHSHHGHGHSHRSTALGGRAWPANTVPLVPGTADTLEVTFLEPGLWLFHCHVVSHADAGMIGLFIVQ
jgi:FtsP/CotA-like multicopper oxidase with cupredoxin domain